MDSKRAKVQWYLRKSELPALGELRMPMVAHEQELFLFNRPKSSIVEVDIDAETIIGQCVVSIVQFRRAYQVKMCVLYIHIWYIYIYRVNRYMSPTSTSYYTYRWREV